MSTTCILPRDNSFFPSPLNYRKKTLHMGQETQGRRLKKKWLRFNDAQKTLDCERNFSKNPNKPSQITHNYTFGFFSSHSDKSLESLRKKRTNPGLEEKMKKKVFAERWTIFVVTLSSVEVRTWKKLLSCADKKKEKLRTKKN